MDAMLLTGLMMAGIMTMFATSASAGSRPLPPGVLEIPAPGNSLVALNDGSLLSNGAKISKDGGKTWPETRPFGKDEAGIAELRDGRVLLFGRSVVGRLVSSESGDGGENWLALKPTDLASSGSPPRMRRIPKTDDSLCMRTRA